MSSDLIVAVVSGVCTLLGSCLGVIASSRLTQYRIRRLEETVSRHNQLIERTYRLEGQMSEVQHDLRDLKSRR
ncbi:MAG: hypothetical protein E7333_07995 [Clostridiales bacterium]|nr:hypothetical protein [Clostridiales bacterium]